MTVEPNASLHLLRPARSGNAFEESIESILRQIKLGVFGVGTKLPPERDLAEMLGVSRSTLREALQELQLAGYLEIQRGRYGGALVRSTQLQRAPTAPEPSADEVEDVLLFRQVVEIEAAALAARARLSAGDRAHLLSSLDAVAGSSAEEYRPKDARLHLAIAEMTGSSMLVAAVAEVRSRISDLLDHIPLLPANLEHSNEQHQHLVDAIIRGDAEAARTIAAAHLEGTASLLRGFLA